MDHINIAPVMVDASGWIPYSELIERKLRKETKYSGVVELASRHGNLLKVPRGLVSIGPETKDCRSGGHPIRVKMRNPPRNAEQASVIKSCVNLLAQSRDHIIQATTGFGKTYCGLNIASQVARTTLIVVTKEDLMDQWRKAILQHTDTKEDEIGMIQQDVCDYKGKKFVLGMVHSLAKDKYPQVIKNYFGLVIFDEVHRMAAETFSESCSMFHAKHRVGLSATPVRPDGKDFVFVAHIGKVLVSTSLLTNPPKVIFQKTEFKIPMVTRRVGGVFKKVPIPHEPGRMMGLYKVMAQDDKRNRMIVQFVKRAYDKGRNIIVFSELKGGHLEPLYWKTVMAGVPKEDMGFYVGGMTEAERERSKKKRVLFATYAMTAEATDIPWLDTAVLATPRSNIVQAVGRILRVWPDKKQPIVYDLVDQHSKILMLYVSKRRTEYHRMKANILSL